MTWASPIRPVDGHRPAMEPPQASAARRLREALAAPEILVAPGAYDAITARIVEKHGFPAVYVTGAGTVNAQLALPDVGLTTMTEMCDVVGRIARAVDVPVFSDADTGYGNALHAMRTVSAFERAGAAGLHIEDQDSLKRCGHLDGKRLISTSEMCEKIVAATQGRSDPDFLIIARSDAVAVEGLDGALRRAHAYVEAGADCIFVEALVDRDDYRRFRAEVPESPLLANMTEFGKTPLISAAEFQELGYDAVIFPMMAFRLMLWAVDEGLAELARSGTQRELLPRMRTREELYELLGYEPAAEWPTVRT
jgi:methylisocitrate lyase